MMYIEVDSNDVKSEQSSKGNELRSQFIYMWRNGEKYPTRFKIGLGSAPAFGVGKYLLGAESFRASRFGGLEIDPYNIRLDKLTETQIKALVN